jgi:hypothetical protein
LIILGAHDVRPLEPDPEDVDLPGIGEIQEGETVYSASITDRRSILDRDDPRVRNWWDQGRANYREHDQNVVARPSSSLPPEPDCAWYCPIHFCGYGWGIYIRESCIFSLAIHIAAFVNWSLVHIPQTEIARHLLLGADRYRPYKRKVYSRTFNTSDCIEESLANAESYRRLAEDRYVGA